MIKRKIYTLIFLIFTIAIFSQDINILENKLNNASDEKRVDILNKLSLAYFSKDIDKSLVYIEKAIQLSKKIDYLSGLANSQKNMGSYFFYNGKYQKALDYYHKCVQNAEEINNKSIKAKVLNNMGHIYKRLGNYKKAYETYLKSFSIKRDISSPPNSIASAYNNLGMIKMKVNEYEAALEHFYNALDIYNDIQEINPIYIAYVYNNIAIIFEELFQYQKAIDYYQKALNIFNKNQYIRETASIFNNIGMVYLVQKQYDQSLHYFEKARAVADSVNNKNIECSSIQNIANTYLNKENYDKALLNFKKALRLAKELGHKEALAVIYSNVGNIYQENGEYEKAEDYYLKSLRINKELNSMKSIAFQYGFLAEIAHLQKNNLKAYKYQKKYNVMRDSIFSEETTAKIAELETKYELTEKENEIKLLEKDSQIKDLKISKHKRNYYFMLVLTVIITISIILLTTFYIKRKKTLNELNKTHKQLQKEKDKSEKLLLNTLPEKVVKELKDTGKSNPELFRDVSVLFLDLVDFTTKSNQLSPSQIINELNFLFNEFDQITKKNNCERIKTIGDAYLAVCGMPEPNEKSAHNIAKAAIEILEFLNNNTSKAKIQWQARIGIHIGPIIGGIIGNQKYIYDIFGDTINTTVRIEEYSKPMKINTSKDIYLKLKDSFNFSKRGKTQVKGKGIVEMYYLNQPINNKLD